MKKLTYQTPTVEQVVFTVDEVLTNGYSGDIELPDHDWGTYVLPKVKLD